MMSDVNKIKNKKRDKGITDFSGQRKLKPKPEIGKTGYQQSPLVVWDPRNPEN